MKCSRCGKQIDESLNFCPGCGQPVSGPSNDTVRFSEEDPETTALPQNGSAAYQPGPATASRGSRYSDEEPETTALGAGAHAAAGGYHNPQARAGYPNGAQPGYQQGYGQSAGPRQNPGGSGRPAPNAGYPGSGAQRAGANPSQGYAQLNQPPYDQSWQTGGGPNGPAGPSSYSPGSPSGPHKKKSRKGLWITLAVVIALAIGGISGWFWYSSRSDGESGKIETREISQEYSVLVDTQAVEEPFSDNSARTTYKEGQVVTVVELAEKEGSNAQYGRVEDEWILLKDDDKTYLRPKSLTLNLSDESDRKDDSTTSKDADKAGGSDKVSEKSSATISHESAPIKESTAPIQEPANNEVTNSAPVITRQVSLKITAHPKEGAHYSGPACGQIILEYLGHPISQSRLAKEMGTSDITDYQQMANTINSYLNGKNIHYYPAYVDNPTTTDDSVCLSRIRDCLDGGCPTIITIKDAALTGIGESIYAVVYGFQSYSDGTVTYSVYVPVSGFTPLSIPDTELLRIMKQTGFLCYLY